VGDPKYGKDTTRAAGLEQAEKSLGEDQGDYRALVEDLPELICRFLPDTTLTYVNKAYCRYLGKSQEELVGHSFLPFLSEEYQTALKEHLASLSREDPVGTFEERVRKPDGEVVWQQWINRAVYDEEGNLVEYHGVGRDLSAQELVEEALLESEERYRNLADASFEGVAISEDGEILYANLAFANMFGYESSEIRGREVLEFKAPEKHDLVRQKISSGSDEPYEAIGLKKDGTRFPIEIRGKTTSHGGRTFRVSALRDLSERKKAEKKLKQSEELYRTVVEDQTELICRFLPDGTLTLVNDAYCRYFSKEREELIGESFMPLLPEEDREEFKEHLASLTSENTAKTAEHRVESPGGEIRWQQWTDRAIFDEEGYPVEYQSVGRDITERKETEARLRESEERFRTAFEDAPIGVALVGLDMRYLRVNHALCEMLGYPQEELLKKTSPEIIHPDDHEVSAERVRQVLEEGLDGYTIQRRYIRGDGRVAWNLTSVSLIRNPEGEPGHFVCLHQDVTERKEAEEALRESEERYRAVMEQSMESIWLFDPDSKEILESNAAFQELLGYTAEELRGMTVYDLVPRGREDIDENIRRNILQRARDISERKYRRKDDSLVDVETTVTVIPYEGREVLCAVARDVTERKKAEEELKESEERYRQLVEKSPETIAILSEGKIVFMNAAGTELAGMDDPEELTGKPYLDFVHPDFRETVRTRVERALEGEPAELFEEKLLRPDGSAIDVEAVAIPTTYEGNPAVQSIIRDITERKEAEEKLRQSEERFRSLVQNATDIITVLEADGTIRYESPAIERILGYELGERLGKNALDYIHPEDVERVKDSLAKAKDNPAETQEAVEFRIQHKDGSWRHVEVTRTNLLNDPAVEGIVSNVRDITERRQAEVKLREAEEKYRSIFENAVEGIYQSTPEGRFISVNPALARIFGYSSPEEMIATLTNIGHQLYVDPDQRDEFVRLVEENHEATELESRIYRKDGSIAWVSENARAVRDDEGELLHYEGFFEDITERKEVEESLRKSEEGLAEAQRMAHLGSWEWDVKSGEVFWSDETFRIYGYDPEEFVPTLEKLMKVVHPDDRELVEKKINAAFDENEPYDFEHRIVRPDGEERVVYRRAEVVLDEEGEPLRMIGTVHDITERKEAEEALRESEEFHRAVMEQSVESIYLFDPETKCVLEANATVRELLGYTSEEFLRMTLYDFIVHDKEDIDRNVERNVLERQRYVGEREYRHKDGSTIEVEASATMIPYYGREVVCVVVRDVTERKELEEQLRYQAFHDSLTELPNRALFLNRLEHALAASERSRESVAVLFLDLDDFKVVNDSMGHEAGNRLLVETAERLQTCVRPGDTVGRIFGDEFAVLLQAPADVDEARQVTERIVERLQRPFSVDGRETYVSCSVGITQSDPNQKDQPKEVLRRADLAMYAAKSRGKDAYEVYNPSMNERAIQRMELENDLRRAVEREEFEVHYQPIVRVSTGEIDGFEALARWKHPERGFVAPKEFIDLAEETGLIRPIGRWVFEEACRQACRWREQHPERKLRMGVNFSTSQFTHILHPSTLTSMP